MRAKLLIGILTIFLLSNIVLADLTVDLEVSPTDNLWLKEAEGKEFSNPMINVSLTCYYDDIDVTENATTYVRLYPIGHSSIGKTPPTIFTLQNKWDSGNYRVEGICTYNNTTVSYNKTLNVNKIELFMESSPLEDYIGNSMTIELNYKINGIVDEEDLLYNSNFNVKLGEKTLDISDKWVDGDILYLNVEIQPNELSEGLYNLVIELTYDNQEISMEKKDFVTIKSPLVVEPLTEKISCKANEICIFDVDLKMDYYASTSISEFDSNNFIVAVMDENTVVDYLTIDKVYCSENTKTCKLSLVSSKLPPGNFLLYINTYKGEYNYIVNIPFISSFILMGTLKDAENKPVKAKMTFVNKDEGVVESKEVSGSYSIKILPSKYDASLNFRDGDLIADIYNASFSSTLLEYGSNINYDSFDQGTLIPGVHTVKVVVLELGFEFEKINLKIPYNGYKVQNEDNLEVYVCHSWNFGRRICNGEWEPIKSKAYYVADVIEVETTNLSAFLLGEKKYLHFNTVGAAKKEVNFGDTVVVEGQVLDSDGEEIEGATITLKIGNYTSITTTKADGSFLGYVTLPYKEGVFDLIINASKEPFIPIVEKEVLRTIRKKEISISLPDSAYVELDKPKTINLLVMNTGQVNLTDIYFLINGISVKNYNIVPMKINKLEPGEQKEVKMTVDISSESCGEKCNQYYLVGMEVKAKTKSDEEITGGGSFTIELSKPVEVVEKPKDFFSGVSGMFTMPAVSTNSLIAGIISIGILILAVLIIKKKKNKTHFNGRNFGETNYNYKKMTMPRNTIVSSMNSIKSQIKDKK